MDNFQIRAVVNGTPMKSVFLGCYPANSMPMHRINGFMIINTSAKTYGHWLLFYRVDESTIIFFDSFGYHPNFYGGNISTYTREYNVKVINKIQLQSSNSHVCGAFVLYIAYNIYCGRNIETILRRFSMDTMRNDNLVENFIMRIGKSAYKCHANYCPVKMFNTMCRIKCLCNKNCHL